MVNEGSGSWRDQDWKGNPVTRDTLKLLGPFGVSDFLRKSSYPPTPKLLSVKGALALCHAAMATQMQDRNDDFIMIDRRAVDSPQLHRDVNPKKRKPPCLQSWQQMSLLNLQSPQSPFFSVASYKFFL